jgi:acyl-CoA dehydrogenase
MLGELGSMDAAMRKMLTKTIFSKRRGDLLQLHGKYGYMWDKRLARAWTDARVRRIAGGTGEIMRDIIGRSVLTRSQ